MNAAAVEVMKELPDLNIAYGVSDEYRFVGFLSDTTFVQLGAEYSGF
jgi:tRNA(His) 5'-end guanylyltransferase